MQQRNLEGTTLTECGKCGGVWINGEAFRRICSDRDKQAIALEMLPLPKPPPLERRLRYLRCPRCRNTMNRVNFAHRSGVVIDICTPHGIWFDQDELRRIVDFILAGGLDMARKRDREELEAARRALEDARLGGDAGSHLSGMSTYRDVQLAAACRFAGGLLRSMLT